MAIWRRCSRRTCANPRRCLEHLWFDVTYRGTRLRVAANEFAIPRMDPNKQRPIQSLEEARDWERVFIGEIKAGRDPRRPRSVQKSSDAAPKDITGFLDAYVERCVKPAALKSMNSIGSRIAVLRSTWASYRLTHSKSQAKSIASSLNRRTPSASSWRRFIERSKHSALR